MIFLYITIAILTSLLIASIYVIQNLLKKIDTYEKWIEFFGGEINIMYKRLKMVDDKNLFEKDDDVGFVFSEIVRVMNEFNEKIK